MRKLLILFSVLLLASCQKEEGLLEPVFKRENIGIVNMVSKNGVDYQMQLYFDLSTNTLKAQNSRDVWDVALSTDPQNPNLFVNPSMLEAVAATGSTDFNATFKTSDYDFVYERAKSFYRKGQMHTDFENGVPAGEVFIIDMGLSLQNQKRGYKLFQITAFEAGKYSLKIANLDHSNLIEVDIQTENTYNYQFIALADPQELLSLEPPKEEWDLYFTKYMERLWDGTDTLDYSVTGCLINPHQVTAYLDSVSYRDTTFKYEDLTLEDVNENLLTTRQDIIGHDWKYYSIDAGAYSVYDFKNYFVKDVADQIYRLHFTGFYDNEGHKGGVTFEYLAL